MLGKLVFYGKAFPLKKNLPQTFIIQSNSLKIIKKNSITHAWKYFFFWHTGRGKMFVPLHVFIWNYFSFSYEKNVARFIHKCPVYSNIPKKTCLFLSLFCSSTYFPIISLKTCGITQILLKYHKKYLQTLFWGIKNVFFPKNKNKIFIKLVLRN